jgi:hypothetical protein
MERTDDLSSEPHRGWGVLPRIRAPLARYPDGGGRLTFTPTVAAIAVTRATPTPAILAEVGVGFVQQMPVGASFTSVSPTFATADVFARRYDFKMLDFDTGSVSTQVVELHSLRYGTIGLRPEPAVG